ncbi:uncharacterized protein LOC113595847 isoform X4 [Acinonyx jubatus]|uniref:Uncharacterized protein LOC113595847 isoform X4 n=1 Tax=Acinonyx jubatus TaxID=32536 RepID=A0ABM3NW48_ACIJB|nr:uncharacterized protein LOC113595847 isoform X4 [Acinonyx jubatus]
MARVTRSAPGQKTFESEFCRESLSENTPQNCPVLSQTHDNTGTEVRTSPGVPGLWVIISAFQSILPDPMPQFSGAKMQNEVTVKLPLTHRGTLVSRQRETEHAWGRNKGRGRRRIPSRPQAPSCQHRARHGARTHGPRDHDPSRSRRLTEPPGHPELENLSGLCGSHYIYIGEHQCLGECICEFWIKGEVNELSDTDASGTRPEEQRQEREQGAEAAVGPERAVLRSPPAPDSPRSTAPTSEPAWSRFDLRDPGLLRTDLELVNWVPPRHPLQIRGHAWVQNSPGSHRTSLSMQERKQAFLMIWKPAGGPQESFAVLCAPHLQPRGNAIPDCAHPLEGPTRQQELAQPLLWGQRHRVWMVPRTACNKTPCLFPLGARKGKKKKKSQTPVRKWKEDF